VASNANMSRDICATDIADVEKIMRPLFVLTYRTDYNILTSYMQSFADTYIKLMKQDCVTKKWVHKFIDKIKADGQVLSYYYYKLDNEVRSSRRAGAFKIGMGQLANYWMSILQYSLVELYSDNLMPQDPEIYLMYDYFVNKSVASDYRHHTGVSYWYSIIIMWYFPQSSPLSDDEQ
jgi:hypothetical protein